MADNNSCPLPKQYIALFLRQIVILPLSNKLDFDAFSILVNNVSTITSILVLNLWVLLAVLNFFVFIFDTSFTCIISVKGSRQAAES